MPSYSTNDKPEAMFVTLKKGSMIEEKKTQQVLMYKSDSVVDLAVNPLSYNQESKSHRVAPERKKSGGTLYRVSQAFVLTVFFSRLITFSDAEIRSLNR